MALRLNGATSGFVELNAPDSAASNTLTLPNGNGTSGNFLRTDGSGTLTWATPTDTTTNLTRLTAVDTSSGDGDITNTAVVYDNLPSTIRRITIAFYRVSGDAASDGIRFVLRTGSGTDVSSGYTSVSTYLSAGGQGNVNANNNFVFWLAGASELASGVATFTNVNGNLWVYSAHGALQETYTITAGGSVDAGAQVTGIKLYLGSGNDFDSGTVNAFYEV